MDAVKEVAGQLGIAAGFFLALVLVLWWVGRHFDKAREDDKGEREKLREDSKEEREQWQEKFEKMNENATRQLESNGNFQKAVNDAHGFQRKEHEQMVLSLQEVTLTLKAMNGKERRGHEPENG